MLKRILAVLVFGSLLLAACGGGDDNGDGGDGGASTGSDGGGIDGGVIGAGECADAVAAMAAAAQAIPAAMSGGSVDLETSIAQLQAFAENAPEEIRDELQIIYAAYGEFAQAMADSGYDPSSGQPPSADAIAALTQASEAINTPEVLAASNTVNAYFEGGCQG
jgi:hypothetical protein